MKRLEIEEATLKFRQTPSSIRYAGGPASLSALTAPGLELRAGSRLPPGPGKGAPVLALGA